jgi:hypothetical protein
MRHPPSGGESLPALQRHEDAIDVCIAGLTCAALRKQASHPFHDALSHDIAPAGTP